MTTREHEHTLNVWLAEELKKRGISAWAELLNPQHKRIDVEVHIGDVVIAVEAEHGQKRDKQAEAIKDADARLSQKLAQCAVAVCYPDNSTPDTIPLAQFMWTVRDGSDSPAAWTTGDIERLVSVIRLTPAQLGEPDTVATVLSGALDGAVKRLSESQKQALARALDLPRQTKDGRPVRNPWDAPAKRALLVVATAVMFHSRLDVHLPGLRPEYDNRKNPPEPFGDNWPPTMALQCAESDAPIQAFRDSWNLILALDYKPIFETSRAALGACPPEPSFAAALKDTALAALAVTENIASLRHDLLGRIFHTVLDTARYDGSFYTTTPAATLLATLAITEDMCDWQDPAAIAKLRITDPACGTGTLLMAAAERIRDLAPRSRDDAKLAAALIEQVLCGYDVNLTATHMAATTLGLLSPTTQFHNMKIWRTMLGMDNAGVAHLGSLEFLDRQPMLMPWPDGTPTATQIDSGEKTVAAEPADLVIMNPPFTRDSLRYDQFSVAHELQIKEREKELFENKPVHLSGNSGSFLVLADFISKANSGSIAAVLPLVSATAISGLELRKFLASHYHIETIVSSQDPQRIYFSENTSIGEMLLICRPWATEKGQKPSTQVVNLVRNPPTPAEAANVAAAISDGSVASQGYGTVQHWPELRIAAGNWGAVQFLSPYLCDKFIDLRKGDFFKQVSLGSIAHVGPAGQRIRDAFTRSQMPDVEGMFALWDHKTDVTQGMTAKPDTYIIAKPAKAPLAARYWEQRSNLLLPNRMRLNTVRTLSVKLASRVIGSSWSPCNLNVPEPERDVQEKALCVYLNSSVGVLAMLGNCSNRVPSYPRLSIDDQRNLCVPDFSAIGKSAVSTLAAAYDQHAESPMLPLPEMNHCPVRRALDAAVIAALGLDGEMVSSIRRQLAMEPSVTGKRYAGPGG